MNMCSVTCYALLLLGIFSSATGQEWRRIVPLHSTCEDVRRILDLPKCEPSIVELQDVSIFIIFSTGPCTSEWNVPTGTVLTLDVQPKRHLRPSDLQIDVTKYSKQLIPNVQNTTRLSNPGDGVSIDLFEDGRIRHIFYGPSSRDEHLRCVSHPSSRAGGTGSMKIDQYGFIPFQEERLRLDEFATTLSGWTGASGYIVVYPGRNMTVKQAQVRASRAQSYLRRKKALRNRVVLTIIGGGREEPSVELFITVENGSPPVVSPQRLAGGTDNPLAPVSISDWQAGTYLGLTAGKSTRADVLRVLGQPKRLDTPPDQTPAAPNSEVWYVYDIGGEFFAGALTVVIDKRT